MFGLLRQLFGRKAKRTVSRSMTADRARMLRARFDAAQTTHENRRHWMNADLLSADAATSPDVRRVLRSRSRYESANNGYARGITHTLANYVIGTGPRLQMLLNSSDRLGEGDSTVESDANRIVEREFTKWAKAVGLSHKLWCMRISQCQSGEAFGILTTNPKLNVPVQLDLRLVEADQVMTPWPAGLAADRTVDGIVFDQYGNPAFYYVLREHPGSNDAWRFDRSGFDLLPAEDVIHLFRAERPGQHRGIPEITSSLSLFAMLRRYTTAVLSAAEQAALTGGVIYTDGPAEISDEDKPDVEPMDVVEMDRGTWVTMPGGYKIAQIKAEQPTTVYGEFKRELINEIARPLNMPFNVAACNSSNYNYASGRLDHQAFFRAIRIDQNYIAEVVLDRVFEAWLNEAVLIEGYLPEVARKRDAVQAHQWFWDGWEHVDPSKEANSQDTRLENYSTTYAREYAKQGLDWETELAQRAKEEAYIKELGLTRKQAAVAAVKDGDDDEEEDD